MNNQPISTHRMPFKPGDKVTHVSQNWDAPLTVEKIWDPGYPDVETELVCFFVEGGFWRASQLKLVDPEPLYYIQDTRQVCGNSAFWWKPDGHGYTCNIDEAWKVPATWRGRTGVDVLRLCSDVDALAVRHFDTQLLRDARFGVKA